VWAYSCIPNSVIISNGRNEAMYHLLEHKRRRYGIHCTLLLSWIGVSTINVLTIATDHYFYLLHRQYVHEQCLKAWILRSPQCNVCLEYYSLPKHNQIQELWNGMYRPIKDQVPNLLCNNLSYGKKRFISILTLLW
jgi:hypothetical protein